MDNSTQLEESNISTHRSSSTKKEMITVSTKKIGAKRFSTRRSLSTKKNHNLGKKFETKEESTVSSLKEESTISTKKEESTISTTKEEPTISSKKEEPTSSTKNERSGRRETHGFILFLIAFMQLLNTIFSNFQNIVWGIILLFDLKAVFAQGATIPNSDIQLGRPQMNLTTLFARGNTNSSFILYPTSSFDIKTFEFQLGEVKNEVFFGITTSCNSIPIWNDLCMKDPSNCQMARLNIDNAESTMKIHTQTLFTIGRICELPTRVATKGCPGLQEKTSQRNSPFCLACLRVTPPL